jgi:hypothetical protein
MPTSRGCTSIWGSFCKPSALIAAAQVEEEQGRHMVRALAVTTAPGGRPAGPPGANSIASLLRPMGTFRRAEAAWLVCGRVGWRDLTPAHSSAWISSGGLPDGRAAGAR